jgi:GNAT superfamily N-acetyltransferase
MTESELERANLANLTSLWARMGERVVQGAGLARAHASRSWPHRWWLDPHSAAGTDLDAFVAAVPVGGVVPLWFHDRGAIDGLETRLQAAGLIPVMDQTAMVLVADRDAPSLSVDSPGAPALELVRPRTAADFARWSAICGGAFGYEIDAAVIADLATDPRADLFLARSGDVEAGTALVWRAGGVAGIHQVGVPAALRGRGIARALMVRLLQGCRTRGDRRVTLQASPAGAGIYRALGFRDQFRIRLYYRSSTPGKDLAGLVRAPARG